VAGSAVLPRTPTGPLVVIAAAALLALSLLVAPRRGWIARWARGRRTAREWEEGRLLEAALRLEAAVGAFREEDVRAAAPGGRNGAAFQSLVRAGAIQTVRGDVAPSWRLSARGRELAVERGRRIAVWTEVLEAAREDARGPLTMDVPAPEAVLGAARLKSIRESAAAVRSGKPSS